MSDRIFQFALIGATIFGTIIAVLVGRILDQTERGKKIIAVQFDESSKILDLSKRNLLLSPKGFELRLLRVFERDLAVANIGFDSVEELSVLVETTYNNIHDENAWADFDIKTMPDGIEFQIEDIEKDLNHTKIKIHFPFLNRGDFFSLKTSSSSDFAVKVTSHHPKTEVRYHAQTRPLLTIRERIASALSSKYFLQFGAGLAAAIASASLSLLGH